MQNLRGLPLDGGGFGGLRRSRREFKSAKTLLPQSAALTAPPRRSPRSKQISSDSLQNPSFTGKPWLRLAAARSRRGSDSPPDCHSLPRRHCATLESFKGRLGQFLPCRPFRGGGFGGLRRSRRGLNIFSKIFTKPLSHGRAVTAPLQGRLWGLPYTVAGYVWKEVVISATVYSFMILCPVDILRHRYHIKLWENR